MEVYTSISTDHEALNAVLLSCLQSQTSLESSGFGVTFGDRWAIYPRYQNIARIVRFLCTAARKTEIPKQNRPSPWSYILNLRAAMLLYSYFLQPPPPLSKMHEAQSQCLPGRGRHSYGSISLEVFVLLTLRMVGDGY